MNINVMTADCYEVILTCDTPVLIDQETSRKTQHKKNQKNM